LFEAGGITLCSQILSTTDPANSLVKRECANLITIRQTFNNAAFAVERVSNRLLARFETRNISINTADLNPISRFFQRRVTGRVVRRYKNQTTSGINKNSTIAMNGCGP
jgi:hypothetical protein